jgi:small GTP-binding protein
MKNIRNFCIIAHIDHGKSTLADRLLEFTKTIQVTGGQMLDDMDLEKERGITIKSHAIQMEYMYNGEKYILNLIDTPGHVDFSYEVSRSIAACEGALLIVDASQGVQAQTISNLYMAIEHDLEIIPIINKCDMASAMPEEVEDEIVELLGCKREEIIRASGKTGMGIEEILAAVIERIPCPVGDEEAPLQALIFDSVFNSFRGIIAYFKITNGVIRTGDKVKFFNTGKEYMADEIGVLKMDMVPEPHIFTEFGSYTVGESGAMLYSIVNQKKQNDRELWNMIDSSFMTTLPDTWAINQRYVFLAINNWDSEYERVNLGGLTCDSEDFYNAEVHSNAIFLPKMQEEREQYIGFFHTGAYQESLSGFGGIQHCLIPAPKLVIIDKDEDGEYFTKLFAKEQSYKSMLKILGY